MSRLFLTCLASLALSACQIYQAASDDSEPSPDGAGPGAADAAPALPDADPSCVAWREVWGGVETVTSLETTPLRMGRSVRFRVDTLACPGDDPGLVNAAPTLENDFLMISAGAWRSGPDCATPIVVPRILTLEMPWATTWRIPTTTEGFEAEPIAVAEAAPGACGSAPQVACERDCDCDPGEQCLSGTDGGAPVQRCARACEFDRECGGGAVCGDHAGLASVCVAGIPECEDSRPCGPGFTCAAGTCLPAFELNNATRHACTCDAECGFPLRCVSSPTDADPAVGRCEITCPSRSDGWCQGPHVCGLGGVEPSDGVCEWVGD